MNIVTTTLKDCFILEPKVFEDSRGFFFESFNQKIFNQITNTNHVFVQDNQSLSKKNVLRGLHLQKNHSQGKLVRVLSGEVFDVAVDCRNNSPTFGQWCSVVLSSENKKQLWIPPNFAHGFLVLSDKADLAYKTTDYYSPSDEICIRWDDPNLQISWPTVAAPIVSEKDKKGVPFNSVKFN